MSSQDWISNENLTQHSETRVGDKKPGTPTEAGEISYLETPIESNTNAGPLSFTDAQDRAHNDLFTHHSKPESSRMMGSNAPEARLTLSELPQFMDLIKRVSDLRHDISADLDFSFLASPSRSFEAPTDLATKETSTMAEKDKSVRSTYSTKSLRFVDTHGRAPANQSDQCSNSDSRKPGYPSKTITWADPVTPVRPRRSTGYLKSASPHGQGINDRSARESEIDPERTMMGTPAERASLGTPIRSKRSARFLRYVRSASNLFSPKRSMEVGEDPFVEHGLPSQAPQTPASGSQESLASDEERAEICTASAVQISFRKARPIKIKGPKRWA